MHTFFLEKNPEVGVRVVLERRERDHLFRTLRCRIGDVVQLCDGRGRIASAVAEAGEELTIQEVKVYPLPKVRLHLYSALPRNAKVDCLLKPVTEAGVLSITPLKCRYSVSEKESIPERWNLLLQEACKQSQNPFLPEIRPAKSVAEAIAECGELGRRIFFGAQYGTMLAPEMFAKCETWELAWLVGPEGGFSEDELMLLNKAGTGISVGPYIFRLENAALAGISCLWMTALSGMSQNGMDLTAKEMQKHG